MNFSNFLETRLLLEFARKGERPRGAISLDNDDIEFLYQFPPQLWAKAIYQRYNYDLHDALKNREDKRRKKRETLVSMLKGALKTGNFKSLIDSDFMSKDVISAIKRDYNDSWRNDHKDDNEAIQNAAEDIAYYVIEQLEPDADYPEQKVYTFGVKGSKKQKTNILAKPFVNRLIHKLERTVGESHSLKSGLLDSHKVGLYGFDLANPTKVQGKDTHKTDGLVFPTIDSVQNAIHKLMGMNFHRYFGELPDANTEAVIPDSGSDTGKAKVQILSWDKVPHWKGNFKDTVIEEEYIRQRVKDYDSVFPWYLFDNPVIDSIYKKTKANNHEINANLKDVIQQSSTYTPQEKAWYKNEQNALFLMIEYKNAVERGMTRLSGGIIKKVAGQNVLMHQDSMSQKFIKTSIRNESDRNKLINKLAASDFQVYRQKNQHLKGPPIPQIAPEGKSIADEHLVHLPMFKKIINIDGRDVPVMMPYVKASKYFRYANASDPQSLRQGYNKNIIHLGHHQYKKDYTGHMSGAAMHPNQMTPIAKPLKRGVVGYAEKVKSIFQSMPKDQSGLYIPIVRGIDAALKLKYSDKKATAYVRQILMNNIPEIHDIIVEKLKTMIDKDDLTQKDKQRLYAFNLTKSIIQQDSWGSGTIRLRMFKVRQKRKVPQTLVNPAQLKLAKRMTVENLARLGRKFFSGGHAFPFDIDKVKPIIEEIRTKAKDNDAKNPLYHMQYGTESKQLASFFIQKFKTKKELTDAMKGILKLLVYNQGITGAEAENKVKEIILPIIGNKKKTMSSIVADFQSLNLVHNALGTPRQAVDADLSTKRTESPVEFKQKRTGVRLSQAIKRGKFTRNYRDLLKKGDEDYLALAHHHLFMRTASKETILNLRTWLEKQMQAKKITQADYDDAMAQVNHTLQQRFPSK